MNLTKHFTLESLIFSQTAGRVGIDNTPPEDVIEHLKFAAMHMETIRYLLGDKPIIVSSGYRSPELNRAIGGATNSAHQFGYAIDFTCPEFGTPFAIAQFLEGKPINYDQLIYEFRDWVHISFDPRNRKQSLTIFSGAQGYLPGIVEAA